MTNRVRLPGIVLMGLCLGLLYCDDEDELANQCRAYCGELNCTDGVDKDACRKDCKEPLKAAETIGEDCVLLYRSLVGCISELPCPEPGQWEALRRTNLDHPCKSETLDFIKACPGVWFAEE